GILVKFGDVMSFKATGAAFDFKAAANQPFATFGSLQVLFDNASGVLSGWGGGAGNFGVGSDGAVYLLPGAFVNVTVPQGFTFGLPSWLPLAIDKVGLIFRGDSPANDRTVKGSGLTLSSPARITDPLNFSLVISGGLKANNVFPVTAAVNDLEVNV